MGLIADSAVVVADVGVVSEAAGFVAMVSLGTAAAPDVGVRGSSLDGSITDCLVRLGVVLRRYSVQYCLWIISPLSD